MRIVLDTNVWISGLLLPKSNAGELLKNWKASKFDIICSPYILEEIARVLTYPKIQKRLHWDEKTIQHYIDYLAFYTEIIQSEKILVEVDSDPKDSLILSTFIKSKADFLVSGDADLLNLKKDYLIISVLEFLKKLEG